MVWSEKDSLNLERIANAIEILVRNNHISKDLSLPLDVGDFFDTPAPNLETDFFRKVMEVYYKEEQLIEERGGGKKSPIRVANNLIRLYSDYFPTHIPGVRVKHEKGSLLIFEKQGNAVCALRVFTDLGYGRRGESGYEDMKSFVQLASKKGIPSTNVYFLIIAFRNGLDNEHVKQLLGYNISNKELLENRDQLETYIKRYVDEARAYLLDPHNQLFFLCSDKLHPNVLEEAFLVDLEKYHWLRPSITELVNKISKL
jgi:hypothetical protein